MGRVFEPIEYLEWVVGRPAAAMHDLGTSALRGDRDFEPAAVPGPLAELPDAPAGVTVETLLATEYGVHPEQVLVTAGVRHANFAAAAAALDAGDVAAVESPGRESLWRTPAALGAAVRRFERPLGDGALPAEAALVTLTNRHDPTGALADRAELREAAASARDAGARLLVDESYAPYVPEAGDGPFGGPSAVGLDGVAVTGSLGTFFGLDELRLGWLVADPAFVERARSAARHVTTISGPSRALGKRALHEGEALADEARELLRANAETLGAFVADREDVTGEVPEGSPFALLDVAGADGDQVAAAAWEAGVLVVPGRFFGAPDRVRVSLGRSPERGAAALGAFGAVLDRL